jgi:hypothetical protein
MYSHFLQLPVEIVEYIKIFIDPNTWSLFIIGLRRELIYKKPEFYIHNYRSIPNKTEIKLIASYFDKRKFLITEKENYVISKTFSQSKSTPPSKIPFIEYGDNIHSIKTNKLPKNKYLTSKRKSKYKKPVKMMHKNIKKEKDKIGDFCKCNDKMENLCAFCQDEEDCVSVFCDDYYDDCYSWDCYSCNRCRFIYVDSDTESRWY